MPQTFVRRFILVIFFALLSGAAPRLMAADTSVKVTVTKDVIDDYQRFVAGREVSAIDYYGGPGARRDVIELVLLQQALKLGGVNPPLSIVREQTYRRTLHQVANGELIGTGALAWRADAADLQNKLYISAAAIEDGEFIVGLYTSQQNHRALNASQQTLRRLVAVTSPDWKVDQITLDALGFHNIYLTNTWVSIVRMLHAQRGDITLAPFQTGARMALYNEEATLLPIPNIKVALKGSRHWLVSRQHPLGETYYQALERGLAQLRQRGVIRRAYRECGFFNPAVTDWPLLQPPQE